VFIDVIAGAAHVREAANLKSLSVHVAPGIDLPACLGDLGVVDADGRHVWLSIPHLCDAACATVTDDVDIHQWRKGFDGMIGYATSSGWVSDDGTRVRAHIDTP
jgi:hypothetical protein